MYRAIFIDIDGTITNSKKELTTETIKSIRTITEQGILVVLCSGRPREYTEIISKQCYASKYIITSSGANIYNYENKQTIFSEFMDKQACVELSRIAIENDVCLIIDSENGRVMTKEFKEEEIVPIINLDIENYINNNNILKCIIADFNFEKVRKLKNKIEKVKNAFISCQHKKLINPNVPAIGTAYYDISNPLTSKGNAIEKLCKHLNIDLKDTIAIGDDVNDISMFEKVGYSVVMGNAEDNIKKYADEITKTNDEDGVAEFLKRININKEEQFIC